MSVNDHFARTRISKANSKIRKLQRELHGHFVGRRVKLVTDKRGTHSRRRYKAGHVFRIYHLIVDGGDVTVWLSLPRDDGLQFELAVWMHEIEFLPLEK